MCCNPDQDAFLCAVIVDNIAFFINLNTEIGCFGENGIRVQYRCCRYTRHQEGQ